MEYNKIHNINFLDNNLPDKCANLIIADPPYFEVKGEFDYIWKSFNDYLKDVEKWAIECKRILADNGTLFWWGHANKIAYSQIILDKYFNLENVIKWRKTDCQTHKGYDTYRCFPPVTEHCLMYSNEINRTGLEKIKLDVNNFKPLRNYFELFQKSTGLTKTKILEIIGQSADHCFRWGSSQWDMPTKETYKELLKLPNINEFQRQEYEILRQEYEILRRPFNNNLKLEDVWDFGQDAQISKKYEHETQKTEKLATIQILSTTKENDLIIVPFVGSGTECAMAKKHRRKYIGYEIEKKHVKTATDRCRLQSVAMF